MPTPTSAPSVSLFPLAVLALLPWWSACASTGDDQPLPPSTATPAGGTGEPAKADADKKAEEQKQQKKDLAQKQRDLDYAKIGVQTTAIDRQVRVMTVESAVRHAQVELDKQKRELEQFLQKVKPREMEEHRIQLDMQTQRADEAKDELAELEAMYKDDEFARSTKELVVKRGRKQLEMANRSLAVGQQEFEHFEKHTLAERERELTQKVDDAERDLEKARLEHQKATMEVDVQQRQADDKVKDLQRDIAELEQKIKDGGK